MRNNLILVALVLMLFSACSNSKKAGEAGKLSQLVVLTYNIHHANPPTQQEGVIDLDTVAATIRASGADLIAIQELDSVTSRSNQQDQLRILAEKLNLHYRFERTIPYGGGAYGIGILSRFPLVSTRLIRLPGIDGIPTEPRAVLMTEVKINSKPFYFGCTHFDFKNRDVKLAQAMALLQVVDTYPTEHPFVVAGDFNAVPDEPAIQAIGGKLESAGAATDYTIPVLQPNKKIDYIFYRDAQLKLLQSEVMRAHSYGSDHLPVRAVFQLR